MQARAPDDRARVLYGRRRRSRHLQQQLAAGPCVVVMVRRHDNCVSWKRKIIFKPDAVVSRAHTGAAGTHGQTEGPSDATISLHAPARPTASSADGDVQRGTSPPRPPHPFAFFSSPYFHSFFLALHYRTTPQTLCHSTARQCTGHHLSECVRVSFPRRVVTPYRRRMFD